MGELETDGFKSGKFDDRWAFTSKSSSLNYGSAAALAAASRALTGFNDELAKECLATAKKVWVEEAAKAQSDSFKHGNTTGGKLEHEQLKAATELLITTGEAKYAQAVKKLAAEVDFGINASWFIRAIPYMDTDFKQQLKNKAQLYQTELAATQAKKHLVCLSLKVVWRAVAGLSIMRSITITFTKRFRHWLTAKPCRKV